MFIMKMSVITRIWMREFMKKKKNGRLVGYIVLSNSLGSFILSENTYFDVGTFDIKPIT